ncbi:MAG: ROK family protein [Thermoleophilaceae bacterium]
MASVLGIDVGGTKVAAAAVKGGEARHAVERPTELAGPEELLDGIEAAVDEVKAAAGEPEAIGIGVPSQVEFATGTVLSSVNIPLAGLPLREELGSRFGVPVFVDNDANCAGLAEARLVPDPPARHLVMITLGTGVGGGVIIEGRIFRGATGLGAELGHVVIDAGAKGEQPEGRFPRPGSLEWLCSGSGLEREGGRRARADPESGLGRILSEKGKVSGREAEALARGGDAAALALFAWHGRHLGIGIAGVVNTFEPEYVVIGGGLSRAADLFLETARAEAGRWALPALWERVSLRAARGGADAGVIGAGLLAAQELARARNSS